MHRRRRRGVCDRRKRVQLHTVEGARFESVDVRVVDTQLTRRGGSVLGRDKRRFVPDDQHAPAAVRVRPRTVQPARPDHWPRPARELHGHPDPVVRRHKSRPAASVRAHLCARSEPQPLLAPPDDPIRSGHDHARVPRRSERRRLRDRHRREMHRSAATPNRCNRHD